MASINTEVYVGYIDVDVDLEDFDTDDLKDELARRGCEIVASGYMGELLRAVYEKRRAGQDYTYELDTLIYQAIGRIS